MATLQHLTPDQIMSQAAGAGDLLHALLECADELREHALEMLSAITDPDCDLTDREFAAITLADLLHPNTHEGDQLLGLDLAEVENLARDPRNAHAVDSAAVLDAMDAEEATFAERLGTAMRGRGLTQTALAERVGLNQSAISMMLARDCRPQKRTVAKLAAALDIGPAELWPAFGAS